MGEDVMRHIVWLSNFCFSEQASSSSGTWIESIAYGLLREKKIRLTNITLGNVPEITRSDACGVEQWLVPLSSLNKNGEPSQKIIRHLVHLINSLHPDLIHVWGTERFWGSLTAKKIFHCPVLLEVQGVTFAMIPFMCGCLSQKEIRACRGIKEWLKPSVSLPAFQHRYERLAPREQMILASHDYIDYQSEWTLGTIQPYCYARRIFKTRRSIRKPFLLAKPWEWVENRFRVFTYNGLSANKGLHIAVRALAQLKRFFPEIQLAVAGTVQQGIRRSGYTNWIMKEIQRLHLQDSVVFLGALNANQLVHEIQSSSVVVVPSLIESYSAVLAESMAVGVPIVATYTGAMPEVGGGCVSHFPIADVGACAAAIKSFLEDEDLSVRMGSAARKRSLAMHQQSDAAHRQQEIYEEIFSDFTHRKGDKS